MPRKKTDRIDMLTAAFLASEGTRQVDIANAMRLSQAVVSRLLKQAEDGYLRQEIRFLSDKVSPHEMQEVLNRAGRNNLAEAFGILSRSHRGRKGPVVRVFAGGGPEITNRRDAFIRQAAPYIRDLILKSSSCGVTWGGMLAGLVQTLRGMPSPWIEPNRQIEFVPLCGEPLGKVPTAYSSSSIAGALGELANGPQYVARSVGMVPAFIPDKFEEEESRTIRKLIDLVQSHYEIFGSEQDNQRNVQHKRRVRNKPDVRPLAEGLSMILTSVGTKEHPMGFGPGTLLESGKLDIDTLQRLIVGDIGGVFIPRPGLNKKQETWIKGLTERWTGLRREHLEQCAKRSAADIYSLTPGVVVVSVGRDRAELIYEAVRLGLVNHLVIDNELQTALEQLISEDRSLSRDEIHD